MKTFKKYWIDALFSIGLWMALDISFFEKQQPSRFCFGNCTITDWDKIGIFIVIIIIYIKLKKYLTRKNLK
jgi:hypothetical protein